MENGCVVRAKSSAVAGRTAHDLQIAERRRVQDLLRYFHPSLHQREDSPKPRVAVDSTLTAFAQLSALRLNCQRSFISLLDRSNQYILAEATQSISFNSEDVHDHEDDALSFGQCVIDFHTGVCPGTLANFTAEDDSLDFATDYVKASRSYYVMNDMSQLEGYRDRPYIAGWPHMRYYAEVPIHSPNGFIIGSLCVVDNKPRDGLDSKGMRVLGEVAEAIMNHLDLCMSKIQRGRAERMIHALGQFVEGNDDFHELLVSDQHEKQPLSAEKNVEVEIETALSEPISPPPSTAKILEESPSISNDQASPKRLVNYEERRHAMTKIEQHSPPTEDANQNSISISEQSSNSQTKSSNIPRSTRVWPVLSDPPSHKSSGWHNRPALERNDSLENMLIRATNLIREAIGLDGVLFLDPRSSDGQLLAECAIPGQNSTPQEDRYKSSGAREDMDRSEKSQRSCRVMSASTKEDTRDFDDIHIPEATLQYLLERFPAGGVLQFDSTGLLGGTEWASGWDTSSSNSLGPASFKRFRQTERKEFFVKDGNEIPDVNLLTSILPGVTSVLLFPLWDSHRDKWLAYGLAWTTDPTRVFQREDFTYLSSFGNAVMADLSRLETIASDKAKTGFISSISHELRSPLHGIMAGMEVLRELSSDATSEDLFNIVETCGFALLDTIDNLLAFAKISRIKATEDSKPNSVTQAREGKSGATVTLSTLVEDIISVTLAGNQFRSAVNASELLGKPDLSDSDDSKELHASGVTVICDISPGHNWNFKTEAGSWKRILLNLLGNSLKYTTAGLISVKLRFGEKVKGFVEPKQNSLQTSHLITSTQANNGFDGIFQPTSQGELQYSYPNAEPDHVILTVEDTGKGMSQDYMTHFLFRPFYQEDQMSPGTGLGLSIVSQLVTSLGGRIHVISKEGAGTKITVEVPLNPVQPAGRASQKPLDLGNIRLGLFSLGPPANIRVNHNNALSRAEICTSSIRSLLDAYATSYGITVSSLDLLNSSDADIIVTPEKAYRELSSSQIVALRKPVIVLLAKHILHYNYAAKEPSNVVLLSQPYGPYRFEQALKSCLSIWQDFQETAEIQENPSNETEQGDTLPRANKQTLASVVESAADPMKVSQPKMQSDDLTVLLVEDNHINLKLLTTSLRKMGFAFTTAMNGVQALEAYERVKTKFPLIFMDIQMPVMDGLEASRLIRQREKRDGLPRSIIVALTGLSSVEAKQKALDCGIDLFLTKPVSMIKLKELVLEYCVKSSNEEMEVPVTNGDNTSPA